MSLVKLRQKAANICEIQVNGGDVAAKVDFARGLFEQKVPVDAVFAKVRKIRYFYFYFFSFCCVYSSALSRRFVVARITIARIGKV